MISCSSIASAAGASKYFDDALKKDGNLSKGADNYYIDSKTDLVWQGKLAEKLGMHGQSVTKEEFNNALSGKFTDKNTGEITDLSKNSNGHRAGWDMATSAPKSVSLAALVGGDDRVTELHAKANKAAMDWLEKNGAQVRSREDGKIETRNSGHLMYATVQHETNRHNEPNLHNHNVVVNATYDEKSGSIRSLTNDEIFRLRQAADGIYKSELSSGLQKLGYEIEQGKGQNFEIKGYAEHVKAFSARSEQVDSYLKDKGIDPQKATYEQRQAATLATRPDKAELTTAECKEAWQTKAKELGLDTDKIKREADARARAAQKAPVDQAKGAEKAVAQAVNHLSEREAAFKRSDLESAAIKFGNGQTDIQSVQKAIESQLKSSNLVSREEKGAVVITTKQAIETEKQLNSSIKGGIGKGETVIKTEKEFYSAVDKYNAQMQKSTGDANWRLSPEQVNAAKALLTHGDRFQAIQGDAGTGKTRALDFVRQAAEERGWSVKGIAPTSDAAKELKAGANIKSDTIAGYLKDQTKTLESLQQKKNALENKVSQNSAKAEPGKTRYLEANVRTAGLGFAKDRYIIDKSGTVMRANVGITNLKNWAAVTVRDAAVKNAGQARTDWKEAKTFGQHVSAGARLLANKLIGNLAKDSIKWTKVGAIEAAALKVVEAWKRTATATEIKNEIKKVDKEIDNFKRTGNVEGKKTLLVVDESSLASSRDLARIAKISEEKNIRTAFQGDTKQMQSVGAGNGFEQIQKTANLSKLEDAQRFKNASQEMKESHALIKDKKYSEAINKIKITEVSPQAGDSALHKAAAAKYMEMQKSFGGDKDKTVGVVTVTNNDRLAVNEAIRSAKKEAGEITGKEYKKEHYANPALTNSEKQNSSSLSEKNVNALVAVKNDRSLGVKSGEKLEILSMDTKKNEVTVKTEAGKIKNINLAEKCGEKETLKPVRVESRNYAAGDTVTARANIGDKTLKDKDGKEIENKERITNGQKGKIVSIDEKGAKIEFQSGNEKIVKHMTNEEMKNLDHGYARTAHKEQGATNSKELVVVSEQGARGFTQQSSYVSLTRARENTEIVTNCKDKITNSVNERSEKSSAIQAKPEPKHEKQFELMR